MTINKALVLMKTIRERISDLKKLREATSVKRTMWADTKETVDPQYDVKILDQRVLELQQILFEFDAAIKDSNAATLIQGPDITAIFQALS